MKKLLSIMIVLLMVMSFATMPAFAISSLMEQGEALLQADPPEYEKSGAALPARRASGGGRGLLPPCEDV
ncbi:MAG: hypothetical protein IJV40_13970 [Oscillospiraceae bacterium]|nr:hypothetical protein [Oscillospiraceae bacterium]